MSGPRINDDITVNEWIASNAWVSGDSSNVEGIMFRGELFVEFGDGSIYSYDVGESGAKEMFSAPSLGKKIWAFRRAGIKGILIQKGYRPRKKRS